VVLLTEYPTDEGVYDWAVRLDYFDATKATQSEPEFIQNFTCANQEHFHFENGERDNI
jgi:hypothetical protein